MSSSSNPDREDGLAKPDANHQAGVVPKRGRLLGLDYGTRRIGIAVSDDEQSIASPLENYTRTRPEADAQRLKTVAGDYRVV